MVAGFPLLIAARKDFPPDDLKEFIAYLKANDSKLNQGHAGVGSIFFTTCLMLNSILGTKPTMVPFAGGAPAMNALVGGQVDFMCADILTGAPQFADGKIKIYALAAPKRNPNMPNVPTTAEAGLPEYVVSGWNGLFAPKDTPKPIVDKLAAALDKALDDEDDAQTADRARLRHSRQASARADGAARLGQERDRALVANHQGGRGDDELGAWRDGGGSELPLMGARQ